MLATDLSSALVKSPLNYTGGKFKLLPQILPLLPTDIGTFVDAFGGGGNVVANVAATQHIYNDWDADVSGLLCWLASVTPEEAVAAVQEVIAKFALSRTNRDGYFECRTYFNEHDRSPAIFYALVAHSFNNQIRFNSSGGFNIPFGDRNFSGPLIERFTAFVARLNDLNIGFAHGDYTQVALPRDAFVYCDPPYLISHATYNKSSGGWGAEQEAGLERWLRWLDGKGTRWALSNVLEHQGQRNESLERFAADFNVIDLTASYSNASYHKKDRTSRSREVLVTNYDL